MKKFFCSLLVIFFVSTLNAKIYSRLQMIEADHWIYDAIFILNGEISSLSLSDSAPLSVSELRNYIFDIDTEKLSESGKILYEKAYSFLYDESFNIKTGGLTFGINAILQPELLYKSNPNIDWTFESDFTGHVPHYEYSKDEDGELQKKISFVRVRKYFCFFKQRFEQTFRLFADFS